MDNSTSPFTREQLLPKEEILEVSNEKSSLFIGIPKETSFQEKRVCLTPDAVSALTTNGHRILIESGAGANAIFNDHEYSEAGAEITTDRSKVFGCPIVLKVEPPTLEEIDLLLPATHSFAVVSKFVPASKPNITLMPNELLVSQVPDVSPAIVTVFFSHVLAEETV